jgi:ring-1,2-phenylacetyl-CoA epoxidase subunit PaaE
MSNSATFHKLAVASIDPLTDDACSVRFTVPDGLRSAYQFTPGQHLALRRLNLATDESAGDDSAGAVDDRRTYSICSTGAQLADRGELRIGVKRISGGLFSGWLTEDLRSGETVEVMTPAGRFGTGTDPLGARHVGFLAAGSGITPVLSIVTSVLENEPDSQVTLMFGNRTSNDVMFLEDLADLKNRFPDRFTLLHVLSGEAQLSDLLTGRIDAAKVATVLDGPGKTVDTWYLCGPFGMVTACRDSLLAGGVAANEIHSELFYVGDAPSAATDEDLTAGQAAAADGPDDATESSQVRITLAGRTSTVTVGYSGVAILDAVLASRPDAPYACKGGVCGTCRARITSGSVRMTRNYALEPEELADGLVLACQSHPTTPEVTLEFQ